MAIASDQWRLLDDIIDMSNSEHMFALHPKKCRSNPKRVTSVWSFSEHLQKLQTQNGRCEICEKHELRSQSSSELLPNCIDMI